MTAYGSAELAARAESYDAAGATDPADEHWTGGPSGYRSFEQTVRIGAGPAHWEEASSALLGWGIKTRSGFEVHPFPSLDRRVQVDERYWLVARFGPLRVREPVVIVAVVDESDRRGFAYGTLEGHPVSGEEAFIVHRTTDGGVWLTLRSLTRAPQGRWRRAFPAGLVAQRFYRRRYLRALVALPTT